MLVTADQILCHFIGDYVLQSDWMARKKTKAWTPAFAHAFVYSIPFLCMLSTTINVKLVCSLLIIMVTHAIIDRYRIARYVGWVKNFLAPKWIKTESGLLRNYLWADCTGTGYHKDNPVWLSTWLMIITDNVMHILINAIVIKYVL